MADRLRFHPLVASDLRRAIRWYDDISVELGNRFRDAVDAQFDGIAAHPERFPRAFDDVRFARTLKFPYLVLFREVPGLIRVLGVFHGASDPTKWRLRVTET
jgi:plasmid stabilization system protein ParE